MNLNFNVAPRYSPGSPALVNEETARRVAKDEQEGYEAALEGIYGPEHKAKAEKLGLGGIVEERVEFSRGWHVFDLLTGRRFYRIDIVARKIEYGDVIIEANVATDYTFIPAGPGQDAAPAFPFKPKGIEVAGSRIIFTDAAGRRLLMFARDSIRVERDRKEG